jgi:hypothetical protein
MQIKTLQVKPDFYRDSPYAKVLTKELEDDSYGLVFNEFLHEIGSMLEVDIIYNQVNRTKWVHADEEHLLITLNKDGNSADEFTIIARTPKGVELLEQMTETLLKENRPYLNIN